MKSIIKSMASIQSAAWLLTVLLTGSAAAQTERPIRGTLRATEQTFEQFPTLLVDGSGWGNAAHLGQFTVTFQYHVDLLTFEAVGSAEFIAANGDSLFADVFGVGTVPLDDISYIQAFHVITGGTGRFENASGTFLMEEVLNVVTHVSSSSFEGTLVLP